MTFYELSCRAFQKIFYVGQNFWPWHEPKLLRGAGCLNELPALIKSLGLRRVLLVTDAGLMKLGLPRPLLDGLEKAGVFCAVYDKTTPNPPLEQIVEARKLFAETNCEAVIAFGGGSPMDCAKMVCFLTAYPDLVPEEIKGILPIRLRTPPTLFAVPTTAGTGSEVTIVSVVTNTKTHSKYTVLSPRLRPKYAVLDPALTVGLPPAATAQTGMDALTHAVESYIGCSNTKETARRALEAVGLIFGNLENAYDNGADIEARENMLYASYCAGIAFTRAYVGYAHGIAHTLGGLYDLPHGLGCAAALPYVLETYGKAAHARLADLYDAAGLPGPEQSISEKASAFIRTLRVMNTSLGIPATLSCIREEDIPEIAKRTLEESNPLYPVPRIWRQSECEAAIRVIGGGSK